MLKDIRSVGDIVWFEYHCNESHKSPDAPIWYRSYQQVTIIKEATFDGVPWYKQDWNDTITLQERADLALVMLYKVRFADGLEWDVFEDELLDSSEDFCRPDPPSLIVH